MKTLLLDNCFLPISQISWKKAVVLFYLNKAEILEEYDVEIHSARMKMKVPSVIRFLSSFKKVKSKISYSRQNIYARDKAKCMYCSCLLTKNSFTIDHVKPKSKGGKTNWENIVACCKPCNDKKGGKTCEEVKMFPIKKPTIPNSLDYRFLPFYNWEEEIPFKWKKYLVNE